jgi:hypothetical protein
MPKLANRNNAMPAIQTPASQPEPQKPSIAETTADAFDKEPKQRIQLDENRRIIDNEEDQNDTQNIDMSIAEIPQTETQPIDIPQKQKKEKKPCSDKLKAHLARCREKSLAKRRANKAQAQQNKTAAAPAPDQAKPVEYKNVNQSQSIDYDRIINGVSNSLYSRFGLDEPEYQPPPQPVAQQRQPVQQQPQRSFHQPHAPPPQQDQRQMLMEYEKKIREDERKRIKAERQAELDRTYKSKGMSVLKNGIPTHRSNTNFNNNNTNPYANAFGRRKY